jgi:flavodoxin I
MTIIKRRKKMGKVIVAYGSTTGTTEDMAGIVAGILGSAGHDASKQNVSSLDPAQLADYDLIILGCSTWGDGELQDDFITFEEKLRGADLTGKKAAVFGPGEEMYPQFCKAVDILEETLKKCGAQLVVEGLKVDSSAGDYGPEVEKWSEGLASNFSGV